MKNRDEVAAALAMARHLSIQATNPVDVRAWQSVVARCEERLAMGSDDKPDPNSWLLMAPAGRA